METMSLHFSCNKKRSSVNYLCYGIFNAFPCKFMSYFRRYKFFVIRVGYECIWECCARIMLV